MTFFDKDLVMCQKFGMAALLSERLGISEAKKAC